MLEKLFGREEEEEPNADVEQPPELPVGISVFQPQGSEKQVLRTPDGTYPMEPERARDLGRLLLARTEE